MGIRVLDQGRDIGVHPVLRREDGMRVASQDQPLEERHIEVVAAVALDTQLVCLDFRTSRTRASDALGAEAATVGGAGDGPSPKAVPRRPTRTARGGRSSTPSCPQRNRAKDAGGLACSVVLADGAQRQLDKARERDGKAQRPRSGVNKRRPEGQVDRRINIGARQASRRPEHAAADIVMAGKDDST